MRRFVLMVLVLGLSASGLAQDMETKATDNYIYKGNNLHQNESFVEAEKEYRKAIASAPKNAVAQHNLGNTLFESDALGEAFNAFKSATMRSQSKAEKHSALHNMGNVFMDQKDYAKAVETYKEALRNNPDDDQTRYNYALAKELLEDQQQNPDNDQNQDQQNQDPQDHNQPQDEGEQEQEEPQGDGEGEQDQQGDQEQEGEQESEQDQESEQQEDAQPQETPTQLSPQQIQNLLEAMNNEEKKVQDKVNAQKVKPTGKKKRKDW
ncbi:MAG: tetratricopeptide repeat protein [Flavobacteriaceae bacterium]